MDINNNTIISHTSGTPPSPPVYHFKILVPAAAAGRIIGKGGTTIAQLQKDAGARVKMSKASEFYPGTTERVCLISGPVEGILKINDFFMENFPSTSMKILVPNSTAGMIIGKGGSYIKQIKEESGAYVQISQKCADLSLPERCVTIVGELDNIRRACAMILSKIVEDVGSAYRDIGTPSITSSAMFSQLTSTSPSSSTSSSSISSPCTGNGLNFSTSYSNNNNSFQSQQSHSPFNSNNNSLNMPGSNFYNESFSKSLTPDILTCPASSSPICATSSLISSPSLVASSVTSSPSSDVNSAQIIESIKLVLRVSGYGEDAVSEITSAMSTLANYGVLGIGLGLL